MSGFGTAIRKYAVFADRSRRKEFWGFVLVPILLGVVISAVFAIAFRVGGTTGTLILQVAWAAAVLALVALLVPYLSVSWRRYQDIGVHGAWSVIGWFIPLVTIVVAFIPGTVGPNEYGLDPKTQQ